MRVHMLCDRLPLIREEFGRASSNMEERATHAIAPTVPHRHLCDLFPSFFTKKNFPLGGKEGGGKKISVNG